MAAGNGGVWFIAQERGGELAPVTHGLAAEARRLAQSAGGGGTPTTAVLLGKSVGSLAPAIAADRVYLAEHPLLESPSPELQINVLSDLIRREAPAIVLLAATAEGSDLAPRLAARLETGLAFGCLRLDLDSDGVLLMIRPAYGGRASCTVVCPTARPQMATLLPDSLSGRPSPGEGPPQVIPVELDIPSSAVCTWVESVFRPNPESLEVSEAEVVVAGGRGVGDAEGFRWLHELAALLGGTTAASRPPVDAGWAPYQRQVGSSGKMVAPRLYIACGISGASQHVVGMRDSQMVVAINQDPYAPIFQLADLGLVGDLRQVLPAALDELRPYGQPSGQDETPPTPVQRPREARGVGPLHIVVCLSRCLDPEARLEFRRGCLDQERVPYLLNLADLHALEEALRLKERFPGSQVIALTLGPPQCESILRWALAVGADDAFLLWDEAMVGSDTLATARILAAAIRRLDADVVLCGARSLDGDTGQVPLQLGELLELPVVPNVVCLSLGQDGLARAHRHLPGGRRAVVACPLPALFAVEVGINRPHYPPLRRRLWARARPIDCWSLADLGLSPQAVGDRGSPIRVLSIGPPKPISRGLFVLDSNLPAEERWQQLLSGGLAQRGGNLLRGSPDYLAQQLVQFLVQHGFVGERSSGFP